MQASANISERIRRVLAESLEVNVTEDELRYCERLDELVGLDSVAILQFISGLELEFGLTLEKEALRLEFLRDLPRLTAYLAGRTGGTPASA